LETNVEQKFQNVFNDYSVSRLMWLFWDQEKLIKLIEW
jgi:hypothetical protein